MAAFGQRLREWLLRLQCNVAVERIGGIDRLDFDQRGAPVGRTRHRAHGRNGRRFAVGIEKCHFLLGCFTLDQREGEVTAKYHLAFARQAIGKARRQRSDAGNCHAAQRDAGDKNVETANPGTQFAQREAQRKGRINHA